jgi:uncharacterized protein YbcI
MTGARSGEQRAGAVLSAVSNALVTLHKEQFGRGPTRARANFAGDDTLVCVLEDALLPAERVMVQMGEQQRVRESRVALQAATSAQFIGAIEAIVNRKVIAFASAIDADQDVVWEIFNFQPARGDGVARLAGSAADVIGASGTGSTRPAP